ncbi:hypothetical protein OS493_003226 [Desmophyllum pertusum]|uniref:Uncharacterized protein n=1 Tax=Desmophyllum pertusum TaxID=174260 RepID=A0A9X0CII0_9CNID|nr:hypothetical protein OS493_003226 [Desmophyllum pertusum]
MGTFDRIRNIRQRNKRLRPGRVQRFFTAFPSVITVGCIPKRRHVPFSFENPVYGSQTIEDIVGLFTKSTTTINNTQDEQEELRSGQRSYSCTHVTDLQREQKEPGTQRTERITKDRENWDPNAGILFSTDLKKLASQRESQTSSCKQSSDEDNGTGNTKKSASMDGETVSMQESTASPEICGNHGNSCSKYNLEKTDSEDGVHETSSVKQERKPGRLRRLLSTVSSVLTGCVPTTHKLDVPFSFENPVHESKTIEDLLNLAEWTTLNDEDRNVNQSISSTELNNGDLDNTVPGSDRLSKDNDKHGGHSNRNDTDKSRDLQREAIEHEQTGSSGSEPGRRAPNTRNLKRSLSWTQEIDSFWDGCTRFKREGLFSPGILRTTNHELREQRLAEQQREKDEMKRKEMEDEMRSNEDNDDEEYETTSVISYSSYDEGSIIPDDESTEEEDKDDPIPEQTTTEPLPKSPSWPQGLDLFCDKPHTKADDGMMSCGILISTEREKRQRKEPGLKVRNDTLEYIIWRFYYAYDGE